MTTPVPGIYRHYKGSLYEVVGTAQHSESEEPLVVYRALYGDYGLAPASDVHGERDERGEHPAALCVGEGVLARIDCATSTLMDCRPPVAREAVFLWW